MIRPIVVRRLYGEEEYAKVLNHNLKHIKQWQAIYPNHDAWIRDVYNGLKHDDYSRIAFGAFIVSSDPPDIRLAATIVLTKKSFTPYLEIKNLIILEGELGDAILKDIRYHEIRTDCIESLIAEAINFSEARGYEKLVAELYNSRDLNREILSSLVKYGFAMEGSHIKKYRNQESTVYLSREIEQVYAYDPYDVIACTKWILRRIITDVGDIKRKDFEIVFNDGGIGVAYGFEVITRHYEDSIRSKFNLSEHILCLRELQKMVGSGIREIRQKTDSAIAGPSKVDEFSYIFDFNRTETLHSEILECLTTRGLNPAYFGRKALESLLFGTKIRTAVPEKKEHMGLPFSQIGGMIVNSNPVRFRKDWVVEHLDSGCHPIYIHIGPRGKYLIPDQFLFLAYPDEAKRDDFYRSNFYIWGVVKIRSAEAIDIEEERELLNAMESAERNDSDILFRCLNEMDDLDVPLTIWSKDEFERHNNYNATNEVIAIVIESFYDLSANGGAISVINDAIDERRSKLFTKDPSSYLSIDEVGTFLSASGAGEHFGRDKGHGRKWGPEDIKIDLPERPSVLFGLSSPVGTDRILNYSLSASETYYGRYRFLPSESNLSLNRLRRFLAVDSDIFVLSAHISDQQVLKLEAENDSQRSVELDLEEFVSFLGGGAKSRRLSILLCCNSDAFAEKLSAYGGIAVGFLGPIEEATCALVLMRILKDLRGGQSLSIHDIQMMLKGLKRELASGGPKMADFVICFEGKRIC
jgi:hypothetical protein